MTEDLYGGLLRWQQRTGRDGDCHGERLRFLVFCDHYRIPPVPDAVALYLVHLLETRSRSVAALRYRLRLLDLAAVLAGEPPPSRDAALRLFLRGLHRTLADGVEQNRTPLYLEDVEALLHAVDRDQAHQLRDIALVLLADATPLPMDVLRQLQWHQVRLRRNDCMLTLCEQRSCRGPRARLEVPVQGGPACPVEALRAWSRCVGPANGYVFATRAKRPPGMKRVAELLAPLPSREPSWRGSPTAAGAEVLLPYLEKLAKPRPRELRDRAVLTLGFAACLTSQEARRLRGTDVATVPGGLLVHVSGRRDPVGVPRARVADRCPVAAWQAWAEARARGGLAREDVAFPRVQEQAVLKSALEGYGPTWLVLQRCAQAGLEGDYGFSSLRIGFIRSAARANVPEQIIVQQAGFRRLSSVMLHVRRERLLTQNAAAMVGL